MARKAGIRGVAQLLLDQKQASKAYPIQGESNNEDYAKRFYPNRTDDRHCDHWHLPAYQEYTQRSSNNACLAETKAYSNVALASILDPNVAVIPTPNVAACASISTPTDVSTPVTAVAEVSGGTAGNISCDLANGGTCVLTP